MDADERGLSMIELLIVTLLLSMVFIGAISVYTSGLRFLSNQNAVDVTLRADVNVEEIVRKINVANNTAADGSLGALLTNGDSQLNLRLDAPVCGSVRSVPTRTTADDNWWHYRFIGGASGDLLFLCDNSSATTLSGVGNPAGTVALIADVNTAGSNSEFNLENPSGAGSGTIVHIKVTANNPAQTIETRAAIGATSKR